MIKKLLLALILLSFNLYADTLDDALKAYDSGDTQKAVQLLTKACDDNNMIGCFLLGVLYDNGDGVKQDKQKAVKLYTKACDGNTMMGCFNLGVLYSNGDGVRQDKQKAVQLYTKACDGGNASGCKNYRILKLDLSRGQSSLYLNQLLKHSNLFFFYLVINKMLIN